MRSRVEIQWTTSSETVGDDGELAPLAFVHILGFDCVLREIHDATAVVTEQAVERGSPIADHKRPDPRRLTIEAMITNAPLESPPLSGGESSPATTVREGVTTFDEPFDRPGDVFAALQALARDPVLVTVVTRHETYDDMAVVSVSVPRDSDTGDALVVTIDLVEVRVAEALTVDAPQPREPRGRGRRNRGAQETQDERNGRQQSGLARLTDQIEDAGGTDDFLGRLGSIMGGGS